MTTMGLGLGRGAAKRHALNETVRLRMAALLPTDDLSPDDPLAADVPVAGHGGTPGPAPGATASLVGERPATGPPAGSAPVLPGVGGVRARGGAGDRGGDADPPGARADPPDPGPRPRFASFAPAVALDRRAVAGLVILLLFAVGYAVQHFWLARPETVAVPALAVSSALPGAAAASVPVDEASGAGPAGPDTAVPGLAAGPGAGSGAGPGSGVGTMSGAGVGAAVVIDVGGRVHSPGLHTLPGGSRVADALRAAGGVLPETDTRNLNLARVLTDGEQLLVGEQAPVPAPAVGSGSGPPGPAASRPPVSLNRATLEQLDTLPGVGPTLAQRILAYRASHGSFRSLDQLRQVSGIGARTYAELRPLLTL
ncbi:helix-hairpin-helix domain-containing protein [Kitasatospora sp. NPDC093550]|uniref:helix-hairpin-helix domain-containing protein n=1 Tax=Kitasatospora sp. NPDC093550 TaxID=3364089 RepID=UPI0037F9B22C